MFKDEARKSLLQKRQSLSQMECIKWDDLLLIQFQKLIVMTHCALLMNLDHAPTL